MAPRPPPHRDITAAFTLQFCVFLCMSFHYTAIAGGVMPDDIKITRTRLVTTQLNLCGTIEDRLKCIAHTHPVFHNDNCEHWDCDPLLSPGIPFSCCMADSTPAEVLELLNGSVISWIGDSTARRANRHLFHWMEGTPFEDTVWTHDEVRYNISSVVSVSVWAPSFTAIRDALHPELLKLIPGTNRYPPSPPLYPPEFRDKRKVLIYCFSTHSFAQHWKPGREQHLLTDRNIGYALQHLADSAVEIIKELKSYKGVDPKRDIILFRLPIAQACSSKHYPNMCGTLGPGVDPINMFVERYQRLVVPMLKEAHPDVGLLDLLSWTWSEDRMDRAECTPSDIGGTHFGTDPPRLAFVQQVLHAVRLLSVGRPDWEPPSEPSLRSLCPPRH